MSFYNQVVKEPHPAKRDCVSGECGCKKTCFNHVDIDGDGIMHRGFHPENCHVYFDDPQILRRCIYLELLKRCCLVEDGMHPILSMLMWLRIWRSFLIF